MIDLTTALATIRAALDPVSVDATDQQIKAAIEAATAELGHVADEVAAFANALDDGTGYFNSSTEFGEQLAARLDQARRMSTVSGLLHGLDVGEVLRQVELALLRLNAATGPHGSPRVLLGAGDRAALQRIADSVAATLLDADMPADPEYEDESDDEDEYEGP